MINGFNAINIDNTVLTLASMNASGHTFDLTGSRFFGGNRTDADYDFFTEDNKITEDWLKSQGFVLLGRRNTDYLGCCDVRCVYEKNKIQVQMVKNVTLKRNIQNSIKNRFGMGFNAIAKDQRKKLWRMMYDLASTMGNTVNHTFRSGNSGVAISNPSSVTPEISLQRTF